MFSCLFVFVVGSIIEVSPVQASYSPPLTRVRIDEDMSSHTPSIVIAKQVFSSQPIQIDLDVTGVQYIGQFERASGLGFQLGFTTGQANLTGNFAKLLTIRPNNSGVDASGYFLGWQARIYSMLWKSKSSDDSRPSAITGFVNLRGVYYNTKDRYDQTLTLESNLLTGGLGAMAEFSINDYISICPYAWITPHLFTKTSYGTEQIRFVRIEDPNLRNPLLVGLDVWFYLFPPNWQDHVSLSILGSFLDREDRDEKFLAGVIGYTF